MGEFILRVASCEFPALRKYTQNGYLCHLEFEQSSETYSTLLINLLLNKTKPLKTMIFERVPPLTCIRCIENFLLVPYRTNLPFRSKRKSHQLAANLSILYPLVYVKFFVNLHIRTPKSS